MSDTTKKETSDDRFLHTSHAPSRINRSPLLRLLLLLFFGAALFLLIHCKNTLIDVPAIGSRAKHYIVARIDFSFPDEEATIILRQYNTQGIGLIYRISEEEIYQKITQLQQYLSSKGGDAFDHFQYDDFTYSLSIFYGYLSQIRFVDMRTVAKIQDIPSDKRPIEQNNIYVLIPPEDLIVQLPQQFWTWFRSHFSSSDIAPHILDFIIPYFTHEEWVFQPDAPLEASIRSLLQKEVPMIYTHVHAGDRILGENEIVTMRHQHMLHAMQNALQEQQHLWTPWVILGSAIICILFISIGGIYTYQHHPKLYYSNQQLALVITIFILNMILAKTGELVLTEHHFSFLSATRFPLCVPFSAMLLASLLNFRFATFAVLFLSLIFAISFSVEVLPFLIVNMVSSMIAVMSIGSIRKRKAIFFVATKAWLSSIVVIIAFNLYNSTTSIEIFVSDIVSTFLFMLTTSVLVIGVLPLLESFFHIMTDITLMEYMDPGNELLRRLTVEAPGTYQHSMVVGNLAESAANAIYANGLFCRVATQYHDIGKLINPQYFTENQLGGMDMHQLLTPLESAQVIISHVSEGVVLAKKAKLPEQFIDIIKEHHGSSLVYYFYLKQIELKGGDGSLVDEKEFRYHGPKPRSKESTIIMLADSLEAASRSLDVFNEDSITELLKNLIKTKELDGQLSESILTFQELNVVTAVLIKTLLAASHPRIKYPTHHSGSEG